MIYETIVGLDPSLVQDQPLKWNVFRTVLTPHGNGIATNIKFRTEIATLPYTLIRREEDICTTP